MNRNIFGITAVILALVVSGCSTAKAPAVKKTKQATKVKTGACCSQPTGSKSIPATKPKSNATTKPVTPKAAPKVLPRLVDLGSTTCIPCKMMTPILDQLSREYKGTLKVEFIDIKNDQESVERYKIQSIPTQIIYDANGKELYRHQGYYPKEDIVKKLSELGIKPGK